MSYTVRFTEGTIPLEAGWDGAPWAAAETLTVASFRPESSAHHPLTQARLLYNSAGIGGVFRVEDRYVLCAHERYGDPFYRDSCVECFLQPKADGGYFNFEFACGGALLCSYVVDPRRTPGGSLRDARRLPEELGRQVQVRASLPPVVMPEIAEPVTWTLAFYIPFAVMEAYVGPLGDVRGRRWRGNAYKCAEDNSHPHWASWMPVPELNFHVPEAFGEIWLSR